MYIALLYTLVGSEQVDLTIVAQRCSRDGLLGTVYIVYLGQSVDVAWWGTFIVENCPIIKRSSVLVQNNAHLSKRSVGGRRGNIFSSAVRHVNSFINVNMKFYCEAGPLQNYLFLTLKHFGYLKLMYFIYLQISLGYNHEFATIKCVLRHRK